MAPPKRLRHEIPQDASKSYKVLCISMYLQDITAIDAKVAELKRAGLTWMTRSALIRAAVNGFDHKTLLPGPQAVIDLTR